MPKKIFIQFHQQIQSQMFSSLCERTHKIINAFSTLFWVLSVFWKLLCLTWLLKTVIDKILLELSMRQNHFTRTKWKLIITDGRWISSVARCLNLTWISRHQQQDIKGKLKTKTVKILSLDLQPLNVLALG